MPLKKSTLVVIVSIVLVSLIFSHSLYGYLELTFNKLAASFPILNDSFNTRVQTKKNEDNYRVKTTKRVNQLSNTSYSPQKPPSQTKKTQIDKCKYNLPKITKKTQKYTQDDGSIGYSTVKNYYEIETNLGKGYESFLAELNLKLNATFQHIERQLGIKLMRTIKLNFAFQTSREDYEDYLRKLDRSPIGNQGIYLRFYNLSVIELKNHKQGIRVAIHEAIHAFNRAYWGNSFRFFNEGMAEYFESISTKGVLPPFNFSSLENQQYPMQISTLLFSETDWHSNNSHELYQNSKALFHFLMNNEKGRKVVLKIMKLEMKEHCTTLSKETIEDVLFDIFPNHEQEFNYWFTDGLNDFLNNE